MARFAARHDALLQRRLQRQTLIQQVFGRDCDNAGIGQMRLRRAQALSRPPHRLGQIGARLRHIDVRRRHTRVSPSAIAERQVRRARVGASGYGA